MKYRQRTFYTDAQKLEMWDPSQRCKHRLPGSGWQRGESLSSIGCRFNRASSSIYPLLVRTGGIRPRERVRSRLALTLIEREEISRGLCGEMSLRSIARSQERPASTISREVKHNGGTKDYRCTFRCSRVGSLLSPPALQAGRERLSLSTARQHMLACVRGGNIGQADPQVVATTNRRLADA
jgi:hypothetical protein